MLTPTVQEGPEAHTHPGEAEVKGGPLAMSPGAPAAAAEPARACTAYTGVRGLALWDSLRAQACTETGDPRLQLPCFF